MNLKTDPALEGILSCYEDGHIIVLPSGICPKDPENSVRYHPGTEEELDVMFPSLETSLVEGRVMKRSIYLESKSLTYPQFRAVQVTTCLPMTIQEMLLKRAKETLITYTTEGPQVDVFVPEFLVGGALLKWFLSMDISADNLSLWSANY